MTTTSILLIGLGIFLICLFYTLFFSQSDEIPSSSNNDEYAQPSNTQPNAQPNSSSNTQTTTNSSSGQRTILEQCRTYIFEKHWDELAPTHFLGIPLVEQLRIFISAIIYPFVLILRFIIQLPKFIVKTLKFIIELIVEIFVELIFNIIIRGIFFLIKGFFLLIFRMFDGI